MIRIGIAIVLAAVVLFLAVKWYQQERAQIDSQSQQITEMNDQLGKLHSENDRLKAELAKVQLEEGKLAEVNQLLRKALEQAKLTGKVPSLPYPPK